MIKEKKDLKYFKTWKLMLKLPEFKMVCFYYQQQLVAKLGLQPAQNSDGLTLFFAKVWEKSKTPWALKTNFAIYKLFKSFKHLPRIIDAIESY